MGEAQRKLLNSAAIVAVDLGAPTYLITAIDRANLSIGLDGEKDEALVGANATRFLLVTAVGRTFQEGMARADGRVWAAWQEVLEDRTQVAEMPRAQLDWMRRLISSDALKLPPALAEWREACVAYFDSLGTDERG